ncbi:DUF6401 family natural product biosynthesis protein [Actinoplanes sp. RD1]|uniref:DUF6401 family natural product biosynthesis protein n=1 Tax=Actinoplanes sp. RD1 TaxID=3064538 RepID=UPI002741BD4B|nr:DUF6401 family natural product biosynthesis protein [Actinoplanes sp. RD1]
MTNFAAVSAAAASAFVPACPARGFLDEMMARVGVDGLAAALGDAGLLAQVDQHAAAVRDALVGAGREVDADGLAAYARSIVFAAKRMGRAVPEPGHAPLTGTAWLAADWHQMRLVAVCMIAESAGLL